MNSDYKKSLESIDSEIDGLKTQMAPLLQKRNSIIKSEMRVCKHELLYSMSGNTSPYGDDRIVCRNCGIGIIRGIGTMVNTPSIDFSKSELVIPKRDSNVVVNLMLTEEQLDALKYPKRFNFDYLVNLLSRTPFNASDVMESDTGQYSWSIDEAFNSHQEWHQKNKC